MINQDTITQTHQRIASHIRTTPLLDVITHPPGSGNAQVTQLKLEYLQRGGTFKARGAFNTLLSQPIPTAGVVAASGGNHGIAIATAARSLGTKANIFVPNTSAPAKVAALKRLGAIVHQQGERYQDALMASQAFAASTGALTSHAFDQIETLCGQGTVAREWQIQNPHLDTVLIAVGGGGLIGGMAAWYAGSVKVIAVESDGCATLHAARAAGKIVDSPPSGLAQDSLGATRVGELMFPITQQYVADSVLVTDDQIRTAQTWLWRELRIASEPGGATAFAALLAGVYQPKPNERVGVLMCGANVDLTSLTA
jgi:threonine dehydratase